MNFCRSLLGMVSLDPDGKTGQMIMSKYAGTWSEMVPAEYQENILTTKTKNKKIKNKKPIRPQKVILLPVVPHEWIDPAPAEIVCQWWEYEAICIRFWDNIEYAWTQYLIDY